MKDAVATMVRRVIIKAVNDMGDQQLLDLAGLAGETLPGIMRVESYGLASHPPSGGEGIIACLGGRSDRAVFIGGEHPEFRPKNLPTGGTMLYDAFGQHLKFIEHNVELVGAETMTIRSPVIILDGAVQITGTVTQDGVGGVINLGASINQTAGNITTVGNVTASGIDLVNHVHPGVQTGGGSTGAPIG